MRSGLLRRIAAAALVAGISLWLGQTALADAPLRVPVGCATPKAAPTGHVFYVDPVAGSMKGNGSKAKPWRTLAEVVNAGLISTMPQHWDPATRQQIPANPNAPIKPGDTIYLLSGNHGVVTIQGYFGKDLVGYNNPDFITVEALLGHKPVIEQLAIKGGAKWVFRGLTFRSTNTRGDYKTARHAIADYWLISMLGPHSDIVVEGNSLESQTDTSQWSMQDWIAKRASGIEDREGRCTTINNNVIRNVGFGILTQRSDRVLISHNSIDYFTDDGIPYASNNLTIENNTITNSVEDGDGLHRDGMQGQPYIGQIVEHVIIRNNTVIRLTDPHLRFPAYLQGIDAFDGVWRDVQVTGNIVVTDAWHGLAFFGASGLKISDNIVLADNGMVVPCTHADQNECQSKTPIYDRVSVPALNVRPSKAGTSSTDIVVTRNLAAHYYIEGTSPIAFRNNACVPAKDDCVIGTKIDGVKNWVKLPGTYGGNAIVSEGASHWFVLYDPEKLKYDLTFKDDPRPK